MRQRESLPSPAMLYLGTHAYTPDCCSAITSHAYSLASNVYMYVCIVAARLWVLSLCSGWYIHDRRCKKFPVYESFFRLAHHACQLDGQTEEPFLDCLPSLPAAIGFHGFVGHVLSGIRSQKSGNHTRTAKHVVCVTTAAVALCLWVVHLAATATPRHALRIRHNLPKARAYTSGIHWSQTLSL